MASKLHLLQSKACQASQFVAKHGSAYYNQLLENNKQHIVQPPTVEKCQELSKQLFYTRLARKTNRKVRFVDPVLLLSVHRAVPHSRPRVIIGFVFGTDSNVC